MDMFSWFKKADGPVKQPEIERGSEQWIVKQKPDDLTWSEYYLSKNIALWISILTFGGAIRMGLEIMREMAEKNVDRQG